MAHMSLFNTAALILTLAALFGYVNHRWIKAPQTTGLVIVALLASLGVIVFDILVPGLGLRDAVVGAVAGIDFHEVLMKGMLSFLLFAGALHVDLDELLSRKWAIGSMATLGVLLSTAIVGFGFYGLSSWLGLHIPLMSCLVFGALISPTDPVAVLGILKTVDIPRSLEAKIAGESLFNDGVGVVVFTVLAAMAFGDGGHGAMTGTEIAILFLRETVGGALLGLGAGWLAYRTIKSIDDHNLEVLITLALVMGGYALAFALHVSGPIAVVVAGLLIGNHGTRFAMTGKTRDHMHKFWSLLDEILNAALFLLIGFEVITLNVTGGTILAAALAIPLVLGARFISVSTPIMLLGLKRTFTRGAIPVLTWGGLRGGISVALVLSLPNVPDKQALLSVTYAVVVFSIVAQGLTVKQVIRATVKK